jgi:asparagine synthase (glutamine-hydrolysing)
VAGRICPKADWLPRPLRAKRTLQNLASDDAGAHLRSIALAGGELPDRLLSDDLQFDLADYDPFTRGRDLFARCGSSKLLNRLLYVDMKTLLADEILTKVDRTSMAVGLEVRVPMLDHRLVELSARMPVSLKLAGGQGKRVLRQTVEQWLGQSFADMPKHGFDVPTDRWFRGPLRDVMYDSLLSRGAMCRTWLNMQGINRLVSDHAAGRSNNGQALWTLFMLEKWAQACKTECVSIDETHVLPMELVTAESL